MRQWTFYLAIAAIAFALGSVTSPAGPPEVAHAAVQEAEGPGVTGLGGIFFKTADPASTQDWYRTRLGIAVEDWGGFSFQWLEKEDPEETGYTVWGAFPETTEYFGPGNQSFMINFRVADLGALLVALREAGVEVVGEMEEHPNGKFAWVLDPEGRRLELWEPVPSAADPYLE